MTDSEYTADKIRVLKDLNSGYVPEVIPTYVALGFLEEYLGRTLNGDGDTVERLYPGERPLLERFISILRDVCVEKNISTQIRQELGPQGHIAVISRELTAYLNGLYTPVEHYFKYRDMQGKPVMTGRIGSEMFPEIPSHSFLEYKPEQVDSRFSFLLGAHIRYGKNNSFELANAAHKVQLIIEFLEYLGASWIRWSWTIGTAPVGHRIEFGPDDILTRFLELTGDFGGWKETS